MTSTLREHSPQVRVTTSPWLKSPYIILKDGLPWTVIVVRVGALYRELAPLWDGELTSEELEAWLTPWGIPVDDNPWDYVDGDRPSHAEDIPVPLRLPPEVTEHLLASV